MADEIHPNFQRGKTSKLPMKEACEFCGEPSDVVVHAFCPGGHCERVRCVALCEYCQEWIETVTDSAPALNGEKAAEGA